MLRLDPLSRVACETLVKNDNVIIAGEITSKATVDYEGIIRGVIKDIGYNDPDLGFCDSTCRVSQYINQQSPDISAGVDSSDEKEQGAGDQGLMFGFACNETKELMPLPVSLAHHLVQELARQRKVAGIDFLKPDAKSQVSVNYEDGKPISIDTIVVSTQHSKEISLNKVQDFVMENVVKNVIPANLITKETKYFINPTGIFVIGGPVGDCGLTGRKIIVDTYGGYSRHGGGAFSGKDPSKVDRSGAYMARYVAKNLVASGIASKCEVQIAYAIGVAKPVAVFVDTFGTGKVSDQDIAKGVREIFSLTPKGIIDTLGLLNPIYRPTATYGHFGREPINGKFTWERIDKAEAIRDYFN